MSIFNHVTVGSNDLEKATAFYTKTLAPLGVKNLGAMGDSAVLFGVDKLEFIVFKPINGKPASPANGGTVGFVAASHDAVNKFYEAGIAAGGTCEGKPGPRDVLPNAYAAYLRDLDGNKIYAYAFSK